MTLAIVGAGVLFLLAAVGKGYYLLPQAKRYLASDHLLLRPAGLWGHGVGMLATGFMLLNFVYALRKRVRRFKRRGPIGPWLRFHVFVGLMSPAVILFHSAFQWGNHLATATYLSLVVVVMAGLIGRFIYGFHRIDGGDAASGRRAARELSRGARTFARRRGVGPGGRPRDRVDPRSEIARGTVAGDAWSGAAAAVVSVAAAVRFPGRGRLPATSRAGAAAAKARAQAPVRGGLEAPDARSGGWCT